MWEWEREELCSHSFDPAPDRPSVSVGPVSGFDDGNRHPTPVSDEIHDRVVLCPQKLSPNFRVNNGM